MEAWIGIVPLLPLLGFLLIALAGGRLSGRMAAVLASGTVLAAFVVSVILFVHLLGAPESARSMELVLFDWIRAGSFSVQTGFLLDPLSSMMTLIITGVGFLIHLYSIGYMHGDPGFNRYFSYLNLFVFFMLLLVLGSNYLLMFVGWEGVGLCSYLLIGFWFSKRAYNKAANKAFIMNRIGDLGLILGVILIFTQFGSLQYGDVLAGASAMESGAPILGLITVLLFIGAMGKSAQIPLYTWLPDAMAGPTPVSALIHAATMVTAGIYMIARNHALFTLAPGTLDLVLVIGLATALFAATIALVQNDIKKVLAYSTVSQLGLMFVALGVGAYSTGIFHMATHAFFKALLFLGAGSVIHALHGEQDIRQMGGLRKRLPVTYLTFLCGVLAISGIPPFAGFFSKDEILVRAFEANPVVWALVLVTSLLTAFYMFRLFYLTFFGKPRMSEQVSAGIHEGGSSMSVPLIVLAVLSVIGGFMGVPEIFGGGNWLAGFLSPALGGGHGGEHHLSHATEYGLLATVLVLTAGAILLAYMRYVRRGEVPAGDNVAQGALHNVLSNKYYVDELYQRLFVQPLFGLSAFTARVIERAGIDRLVDGTGYSVIAGSRIARLLQTGNIGFYVFLMVIGVIVLLALNSFIL